MFLAPTRTHSQLLSNVNPHILLIIFHLSLQLFNLRSEHRLQIRCNHLRSKLFHDFLSTSLIHSSQSHFGAAGEFRQDFTWQLVCASTMSDYSHVIPDRLRVQISLTSSSVQSLIRPEDVGVADSGDLVAGSGVISPTLRFLIVMRGLMK